MPSRSSFRALSVFTLAGVVLAACGGATDSGLFDGPGTASPDAGGTGNGTNQPIQDAGTSSNPGHDSGKPSSHDAAPPAVDANPPVDSAPSPPSATIDCNVSNSVHTCDAATSVCCRTSTNSGQGNGNETFACTTAAACAQQNALAIPCDNAGDCAAQGFPSGTVCCVTADSNTGTASSVACVAQSDCSAQAQTWLCNGGGTCPANTQCATSTTTIPGYMICR